MELLNLKAFFEQQGKSLVKTQKTLLANKKGVAQTDQAPHNAPSTIKAKGFDHWLKATDETHQNVFQYEAESNRLTLFASTAQHSGKRMYKGQIKQGKSHPRFEQLIAWHTTGYSGFYNGLPSGTQFFEKLKVEINRQLGENVQTRFKKYFPK